MDRHCGGGGKLLGILLLGALSVTAHGEERTTFYSDLFQSIVEFSEPGDDPRDLLWIDIDGRRESYRVYPGAVAFLYSLLLAGHDLSFFTSGDQPWATAIVDGLGFSKLPKGSGEFRVLGKEQMQARSPGTFQKMIFNGALKKDLNVEADSSTLRQSFLLDDDPQTVMPGQEGNFVWLVSLKGEGYRKRFAWARGLIDVVLEQSARENVDARHLFWHYQWFLKDPDDEEAFYRVALRQSRADIYERGERWLEQAERDMPAPLKAFGGCEQRAVEEAA